MNFDQLMDLAKVAVQIAGIIRDNVQTGKSALKANELSELKATLEQLHGHNLGLGAELDGLLASAEQK